jgi:hypothetical protein
MTRDADDRTRRISPAPAPPDATRVTSDRPKPSGSPPRDAPTRDLARYLNLVGVTPAVNWGDAPAPSVPAVGQGRYRDAGRLGEGGLGEVILAYDVDLARHVAFKRLRPEHRQDPTLVQAFLEEAILTGRLEHPHIVPVHDIGVSPEDGPYYTMKRLDGESLHAVLGRLGRGDAGTERAYPLARRIAVFLRVLRGMAHAHDQGIIHCDLKPSNILVGAFGEVTIVDWGLALALGDDVERQARARMWSGSPGYMAPEQAMNADVRALTTATDIWSLGAILYELLTLAVPQGGEDGRFRDTRDGDSRGDKAWTRTFPPIVPLQARRPREAPAPLVALCEAALAEAPAARPASVREMLAVVSDWLEGRQAEERRAELVREAAEEAVRLAAALSEAPSGAAIAEQLHVAPTVAALTHALSLAPADSALLRAGSELYWAAFTALHRDALPAELELPLRDALDALAAAGLPALDGADGARVDAWMAAMEELARDGLPRVGELLARIRAVKATELFADLDGPALRDIAEALEPLALPSGTALFAEGDPGDALYVLVEGAVTVEAGGRVLTQIPAPACIGEVALVRDPRGAPQTRTATVRAEGDLRLHRLSAERFDALARRHGAIALGVMRLLATRLRAATERERGAASG